jgi:K+-transporting ATPase KdpF subunit
MKAIMNIFLVVPASLPQDKMPIEMNSYTWYVIGAIVAFLLLMYLVISLIKPEKF